MQYTLVYPVKIIHGAHYNNVMSNLGTVPNENDALDTACTVLAQYLWSGGGFFSGCFFILARV